tara:strand:+ start:369 stop:632 length:264 start_codon:yes stop_codon:yes gene_type:complete
MKITKSQLKRIIKEELESVLSEGHASNQAYKLADKWEPAVRPEEIEEVAKQLAKEAGYKDKTTYDWHDYMDAAKMKLLRGDLTSGGN